MADAKKCDVCGTLYERYTDGGYNTINLVEKSVYGIIASTSHQLDLCPNCKNEFEHWRNGETVAVAYFCDGESCDGDCLNEDCTHTNDIRHAINFEKLDDYKHIEKDENWDEFIEKLHRERGK